MGGQSSINPLTVFLASPRDLPEERDAAEIVVNNLNKIFRQKGLQIFLIKWEDLSPSFGRPQEIINQELAQADLFVGLIFKRWGSEPGGSNGFSSGFEEEFNVACKLISQGKLEDVSLYFKEIPKDTLEDAGPQLQKVIEFRKNAEREKKVFFSNFSDIHEWKESFQHLLLQHCLRKLEETQESKNLSPETKTSQPGKNTDDDFSKQKEPKGFAGLQFFDENVSVLIKGDWLEDIPERFKAIRSLLYFGNFYRSFTGDYIFGHVEANYLFLFRKNLFLSNGEKIFLAQSALCFSDLFPLWYWLNGAKSEDGLRAFFLLAGHSENEKIAKGAIVNLRNPVFGNALTTEDKKNLLKQALKRKEVQTKKEALQLLSDFGVAEDLPQIEQLINENDPEIVSFAINTKLLILLRSNPNNCLEQLVNQNFSLNDQFISELKKLTNVIDMNHIYKCFTHKNSKLREFALTAIIERGEFSDDFFTQIKEDSSEAVRALAYFSAIRKGRVFEIQELEKAFPFKQRGLLDNSPTYLAEDFIREQFRFLQKKNLEEKLVWYTQESSFALQVLIEKDKEYQRKARTWLQDNLTTFQKFAKDKFLEKKKLTPTGLPIDPKDSELIDVLRLDQHWRACILGLEPNATKEDVRFFEQRFKTVYPDEILAIAKVLIRFCGINSSSKLNELGTSFIYHTFSDRRSGADLLVECMVENKENLWDFLKETSFSIILKINLLEKINPKDFVSLTIEEIIPFLLEENANFRANFLRRLILNKNKTFLKKLLAEYLEQPTYYYNVIFNLDRAIYCTENILNGYLESELFYPKTAFSF